MQENASIVNQVETGIINDSGHSEHQKRFLRGSYAERSSQAATPPNVLSDSDSGQGSDLDPSFVPLQGPPISHLEKKNTPNRKNLIVRDPVVYSPPPKGALVPVIPKPTRWLGTRPNAIIDAEEDDPRAKRAVSKVKLILSSEQLMEPRTKPRKVKRKASPIDNWPAKRTKRISTAADSTLEVQSGTCNNSKYRDMRKCVACIAKKVGEPCRFKGIRAFKIENGKPIGPPIWRTHGFCEITDGFQPIYSESWYQKPTSSQIRRMKMSVARLLLPILQEERKSLDGKESCAIQRRKETDVRVTCDRCLTSIFAVSFVCPSCGREVCLECFSRLQMLDLNVSKEVRLTVCGHAKSGQIHRYEQFMPVCRFDIGELDTVIQEMERQFGVTPHSRNEEMVSTMPNGILSTFLPADFSTADSMHSTNGCAAIPNTKTLTVPTQGSPASPPTTSSTLTPLASDDENISYFGGHKKSVQQSQLRDTFIQLSDMSARVGDDKDHRGSVNAMIDRGGGNQFIAGSPPNPKKMSISTDIGFSGAPPPSLFNISVHQDPANVGSNAYSTFHHSELTEELFQSLWRDGATMVITGLLEKMEVSWTPAYFIENYGTQLCSITDCDSNMKRDSDVKTFFDKFGQYDTREGEILKLKDWPPSADLRTTFPALFEDFYRAAPAPTYTRHDGFYNIAAHLPTNVVVPDMGPKMYNALKSREERFGSTRLHMDMADAVNIMLYSAAPPGEDIGVAVWDIYSSSSSPVIRQFLKEEFPLESAPIQYVDPIHSQYFYLTPHLRKKLWDRYQVRSWRIYQKPGDAVFIPAGCAHQVCNLADCIKVAVDFVSPENLDRCSQLTKEFRSENNKVIWKEDILQLSNMCWSAWEHTCRLEKELRDGSAPPDAIGY